MTRQSRLAGLAFLAALGAIPARAVDDLPNPALYDFRQAIIDQAVSACMEQASATTTAALHRCFCPIDVVDERLTLDDFLIATGQKEATHAEKIAARDKLKSALAEARDVCA